MRILGIETSCDETGAAVVEAKPGEPQVKLLSNVVASSLALHAKTGGIIPEVAAREQVWCIIPVIEETIKQSNNSAINNLDSIAVTVGPGLVGSLLVGVETAKTLAYVWGKPIIPVNHLVGHIYANFIGGNSKSAFRQETCSRQAIRNPRLNAKRYTLDANIKFPALALLVSGGHTDLVLMKNHGKFNWLGGTRDDAAGEAFDKIGRLLGLPYPGGPAIAAEAAKSGIRNQASPRGSARGELGIRLPRPMISEENWDFSFSGLKTAVLRIVRELKARKKFNNETIQQLASDVQEAITDVLVTKTIRAAQKHKVKSILLSGGVAANQKLRDQFKLNARRYQLDARIFVPAKNLCTDNAGMIAAAAFFNFRPIPWQKIKVEPGLHF